MLSGVGGPTVEIAKQSMSYGEYLSWISYFEKHGSFNIARRIDWGMAHIANLFAQHMGFKFKDGRKCCPNDFTLFPAEVEEKTGTIDDIANLLRSTAIKDK